MQNKILYRSGKFYALRLPEEPTKPGEWAHQEFFSEYYEDKAKWHKEVESLMANPPEIVNPELLDYKLTALNDIVIGGNFIIDGDIFPLPSNMRFEEQLQQAASTHKEGFIIRTVIRIVKAETKQQENVPDNKSSETGNIPEHKQYFNAVANLAHKCIQFNDGEMQGFDMVMFEALLPIMLKPILKIAPPEPDPKILYKIENGQPELFGIVDGVTIPIINWKELLAPYFNSLYWKNNLQIGDTFPLPTWVRLIKDETDCPCVESGKLGSPMMCFQCEHGKKVLRVIIFASGQSNLPLGNRWPKNKDGTGQSEMKGWEGLENVLLNKEKSYKRKLRKFLKWLHKFITLTL